MLYLCGKFSLCIELRLDKVHFEALAHRNQKRTKNYEFFKGKFR